MVVIVVGFIVGSLVLAAVVDSARDRALRRQQMEDRNLQLRILREIRDREAGPR